MPHRSTTDRLLHELSRAVLGSRAPSRRSITNNPLAAAQTLARYAVGGRAAASPGILNMIGRVLGLMGLTGGGTAGSRSRVASRRALARIAGLIPETAPAGVPPGSPPGAPPAAPAPGGQQPPPGWAGGGFSSRFPGSTLSFGAEPPLPGQQSPFGEEIRTPNSTNVYSISYMRRSGERTGTLYVTYRAAKLNTGSLSSGHKRAGKGLSRRQLIGKLGSTVSGKTGDRGPQYAYLRVPPAIYSRLKAVAGSGNQVGPGVKSPGTGVWELLRNRGSAWGHKFNYVLVSGSVTIQNDMSGVYVPRKATQSGFKSRAVRDIGGRTFQTSTLAPRTFSNRTASRRG